MEYLATPIEAENTNLFYREDSPGSDCSTQNSNNSDEVDLEEQERRITKDISEQIAHLMDSQSVLTANDWESFITE